MSVRFSDKLNFTFGGQRIELNYKEYLSLRGEVMRIAECFEQMKAIQPSSVDFIKYISTPFIYIDIKDTIYKVSISEIIRTANNLKSSSSQ